MGRKGAGQPASAPAPLTGWTSPSAVAAGYSLLDSVRRAQGDTLAALGFGAQESAYTVVASGSLWRLREYSGATGDLPLLIVAAPIKRPYIWDLAPAVSAVRRCLNQGLRVFLLEWLPATSGAADAGLEAYANHTLTAAVDLVILRTGGVLPFLMGHSLGGTLAALHAAIAGNRLRGLVLLGAPLCFAPGSSRFRDALVSTFPAAAADVSVMPGSLLTAICASASPDIFVWSRSVDAGLSAGNPEAMTLLTRVERWTLDEVALSGALVREVFEQLYSDDGFCKGRIVLGGQRLGPERLGLPTLLVANKADDIAPPAATRCFARAMPTGHCIVFEQPGELGVGLQHLAPLVGRDAHARLWPEIIAWLHGWSSAAAVLA
jgi:polyhydroxyalkanoate synthase subunit PhaC